MPDNLLAVNVLEAARRLGVSPRTIATLLARGELASRRVGRRRVIPVHALENFLRRDHRTGVRIHTNKFGNDPNSKGAKECH
jgi:excisionase family DNA binding protein